MATLFEFRALVGRKCCILGKYDVGLVLVMKARSGDNGRRIRTLNALTSPGTGSGYEIRRRARFVARSSAVSEPTCSIGFSRHIRS